MHRLPANNGKNGNIIADLPFRILLPARQTNFLKPIIYPKCNPSW